MRRSTHEVLAAVTFEVKGERADRSRHRGAPAGRVAVAQVAPLLTAAGLTRRPPLARAVGPHRPGGRRSAHAVGRARRVARRSGASRASPPHLPRSCSPSGSGPSRSPSRREARRRRPRTRRGAAARPARRRRRGGLVPTSGLRRPGTYGAAVAVVGTALAFAIAHVPSYGVAVFPVDLGAGLRALVATVGIRVLDRSRDDPRRGQLDDDGDAMRRIGALVALGVVAASCTTASPDAESADTVVVAAVYPLSGSQGQGGVDEHRGAMLAADLVNADGGIAGRTIEIRSVDVTAAEAAPGAIESFAAEGIDVVLGSYGSTISAPASETAAANDMLFWETGAVGMLSEGSERGAHVPGAADRRRARAQRDRVRRRALPPMRSAPIRTTCATPSPTSTTWPGAPSRPARSTRPSAGAGDGRHVRLRLPARPTSTPSRGASTGRGPTCCSSRPTSPTDRPAPGARSQPRRPRHEHRHVVVVLHARVRRHAGGRCARPVRGARTSPRATRSIRRAYDPRPPTCSNVPATPTTGGRAAR